MRLLEGVRTGGKVSKRPYSPVDHVLPHYFGCGKNRIHFKNIINDQVFVNRMVNIEGT